MKEAGILFSGILTITNKEAEQAFSENKAAFSFNGSWGINTYKQMNPDLKYDTMPIPSAATKYSPKIWAGAGSSFVVNSASCRKEAAIEFLQWLTAKEQQLFLIKKTNNLPAIKGCQDDIDVSLAMFLKHMDNTTHPNLWPLNEEPRVIEAINTGIQKIIIAEKTPEEVACDVEKAKRLTLKRKE
jgi:raffinose/stachyose/melibiose transport system substrate-binding protein